MGMLTALGLMSGTSLDGIDAAILRTDGVTVDAFGPCSVTSYTPALRDLLKRAAAQAIADPDDCETAPVVREATQAMTFAHAEAVMRLLDRERLSAADIDIIGFHGQTILHQPERRRTVQIGDAPLLARLSRTTVAADFRSADVAAGGQGAPLAPLYHAALVRNLAPDAPVAVVNLGGVANVTWIDADRIIAFDTGPGNGLIDQWCALHHREPFDRDGCLAAAGTIHTEILHILLAHPYFDLAPPKSLDRYDFSLAPVSDLSPADGAATLAAFTAAAVAAAAEWLPAPPRDWIVCGGGRHNRTLMAALAERLAGRVMSAEAVGWRGDVLEAEAFAYLAVRVCRGLPLSLPETTGAPRPLPGGRLYLPPTAAPLS